MSPEYANLKEIKCIADDGIEAVPYLILEENDPLIKDLPVSRDIIEPVIIEEEIEEETLSEKKTLFQKIWKGKKII